MSQILRGAALATSVLLSSGCFTYIPVEIDAVPPGEDVRVLISREAMSRLRETDDQGLPGAGVPMVRGRMVRHDPTGIAIRIPIANRQVGFLQAPIDRQVSIPSDGVVQIELREFHKGRTGLAIGTAVALVASVVFFTLDDARMAIPQEPNPGNDASRIPLDPLTGR